MPHLCGIPGLAGSLRTPTGTLMMVVYIAVVLVVVFMTFGICGNGNGNGNGNGGNPDDGNGNDFKVVIINITYLPPSGYFGLAQPVM